MTDFIELARTNLLYFIVYMFPEYEVAPHHRLLCEKVQETITTPNARLMVSLPPRHGKSTIISEFLPAFLFGVSTRERIITASHTAKLATFFGKKVRRIINSPAYRALFPQVKILGDGESGSFFELDGGSQYMAIGRDGGVSGFDSTFTIIDDLLNSSKEAKSPTVLSSIHEWWDSTMASRTMPGGRIIIVSTRWSEQDLQGYLLEKEPDVWSIINIPALCENPETDLLGRDEGEALWEDWYSAEKLNAIKAKNAYQFSALYQGNPVAKTGNTFNMSDIKLGLAPNKFDCTIMSWDTASTDKNTSCYTAGVLIGIKDKQAYLLDFVHQRVKFPSLIQLIKSKFNEHKPDYLLIEDASSGTQVIQILQTEPEFGKHLVPISKKGSKDEKVDQLLYAFANKLLTFVTEPTELVKELRAYPYGQFDDGVIALGHAISWWLYKTKVLTVPITPKLNLTNLFSPVKRKRQEYGLVPNMFTSGRIRKNAKII